MACASSRHECPVCHEDYDLPKILPCGHVVCQKCVLTWVEKEGRAASCPLCRASILSPGSGPENSAAEVRALPSDLYTAGLVENHHVLSPPHVCGVCENNTAATHYCIQCAIKLCSSCVKGHKKIPTTRSHSLESLNNLDAAQLAKTRHVMCEAHPDRPAEMYCLEHQEVICMLCGSTSHGGCSQRRAVADMAKETQQKLNRRLSDLKEKEQQLARQMQSARDHLTAERKKVKDTFDDLHKILDSQRQKFDSFLQAVESSLATRQTSVEKTRATLTQNAKTLGHLVESASGGALLQMLKALRCRLDDLMEKAEEGIQKTKNVKPADFVVDTEKLTRLKSDVAALGYVARHNEFFQKIVRRQQRWSSSGQNSTAGTGGQSGQA